jgi:dolichyl-diphosphooligosaccharide--protein glycosyltransferase
MYNYFVSGESRSYGFARSNYEEYLSGTDEASWYERFEGRVGYVVYDSERRDPVAGTIGAELASYTERDTLGELPHHRMVHVSPGGRFLVFAPVAGAILTGEAEPNQTMVVEATLAVEDETVAYQRSVGTDSTGAFELRVPYPGTYTVDQKRAVVTEQAVLNGSRTRLE